MDNYRKKFVFEMRSTFKELKAIFPLVNNMLLNGCTCEVKISSPSQNEYSKFNNIQYLEICIFKGSSTFSALTIRRDLVNSENLYWNISAELKDIKENEHIFFEVDDNYKSILVYISEDIPEKDLLTLPEIDELYKGTSVDSKSRKENLNSNNFTLLYNLDFFLKKDFPELVYLFQVFNLMIYENAYHFVQMKTRNLQVSTNVIDLKLKLYYESQNRPSISITSRLREDANQQTISIYNFLTLTYAKPMLFNLNYSEKHLSLQAYCNENYLAEANRLIETVFFPT